ncbi:unnamed protein product, partial [Lepidochelys olivacea]
PLVRDFVTHYPEAVPLASIEADTVADALLTIFSRVGFPKEVLTDQGSNFMSALLRSLWEKCGVRHDWASAYHPQSNGLVERERKTAQDLEREVRDMLALGGIQPLVTPWASLVVLVPKKDGSVQFRVDYRKLNAITVSDAYPMPRPDELLDKLGGARYLTTMDLTKGYWQVPLDADARLKSDFITPLGLYVFLTLPFGLKGAPATFQRLVDQLLRGMESFAVAYIYDICVFRQTWEDHVSQVRQAPDRLQGAGLTVKAEKCKQEAFRALKEALVS